VGRLSLLVRTTDFKNRVAGWFVDREFFMRSNGQVRFLRISAQLQRRVASVFALVIGFWLIVTLGMAINQVSVSFERMALSQKEARIQTASERVAKYSSSIDDVSKDLKKRQDMLESTAGKYFGKITPTQATTTGTEDNVIKKVSLAIPQAAGLAQIEARQIRFAEHLTKIANLRATRAANEIRKFGLNPDQLAGGDSGSAMGGPFIPFFGEDNAKIGDPRFDRMAHALERMNAMELALASVPTSMPAEIMMMSSGFGYRHDPFTGAGAMHGGLDFKGPIGTAILAAASGEVTSAGRMAGYGNCIEITHANGLITRYAHLSAFTVSLGQNVKRGVQIARMGSTGRSTGSHLHFEVRLNGQAINPLKFLEANSNVLEVKTVTGSRTNSASATGA
jgi:murein DD-endopeptidase MepM/ murein hydrolase activator NlpD